MIPKRKIFERSLQYVKLVYFILIIIVEEINCYRGGSFQFTSKNAVDKTSGSKSFLVKASNIDFSFLTVREQDNYVNSIQKLSIERTKNIIQQSDAKVKMIEISFPESRRPDVGAAESFDISRSFAISFIQSFSSTSFGKDAWLLYPDRQESSLAKNNLGGQSTTYRATSIITAYEYLKDSYTSNKGDNSKSTQLSNLKEDTVATVSPPKFIVAISPGFNVEEWIQLAKVIELPIIQNSGTIIVCINGNLDRLRNGYYPRIFYPGLYDVTRRIYRNFQPAGVLQALAIGGDRFAAYTWQDPAQFVLLLRNAQDSKRYDLIQDYYDNTAGSSNALPTSPMIYDQAKKLYLKARNSFF